MRCCFRLVLLLILSIALRGFAGSAFAMPLMAIDPVQMTDCAEHAGHDTPPMQSHHLPGDKACQISCDLGASPALPAGIVVTGTSAPSVLTPTHVSLAISDAPPPDHPPLIR
jgi:hypothetical protein